MRMHLNTFSIDIQFSELCNDNQGMPEIFEMFFFTLQGPSERVALIIEREDASAREIKMTPDRLSVYSKAQIAGWFHKNYDQSPS